MVSLDRGVVVQVELCFFCDVDETEEWFALELENNSDPEEEEWEDFWMQHMVCRI